MRTKLPTVFCLASLMSLPLLAGCHHEHHDHDDVVLFDSDHHVEHHGYYDEHHDWHGGYYDDHHAFHDDPHDFAGRP